MSPQFAFRAEPSAHVTKRDKMLDEDPVSAAYLKDPRRNTYEGEIAALMIFAKYDEKGLQGCFDMQHEHDIGYGPTAPAPEDCESGDTDDEITAEQWSVDKLPDAIALSGLGWSWDNETECWCHF